MVSLCNPLVSFFSKKETCQPKFLKEVIIDFQIAPANRLLGDMPIKSLNSYMPKIKVGESVK